MIIRIFIAIQFDPLVYHKLAQLCVIGTWLINGSPKNLTKQGSFLIGPFLASFGNFKIPFLVLCYYIVDIFTKFEWKKSIHRFIARCLDIIWHPLRIEKNLYHKSQFHPGIRTWHVQTQCCCSATCTTTTSITKDSSCKRSLKIKAAP